MFGSGGDEDVVVGFGDGEGVAGGGGDLGGEEVAIGAGGGGGDEDVVVVSGGVEGGGGGAGFVKGKEVGGGGAEGPVVLFEEDFEGVVVVEADGLGGGGGVRFEVGEGWLAKEVEGEVGDLGGGHCGVDAERLKS